MPADPFAGMEAAGFEELISKVVSEIGRGAFLGPIISERYVWVGISSAQTFEVGLGLVGRGAGAWLKVSGFLSESCAKGLSSWHRMPVVMRFRVSGLVLRACLSIHSVRGYEPFEGLGSRVRV